MKESELVSVIIPSFNRASYILDALYSVYNQNYPKIEIIVVDDGSSDGTYEILKSEQDKNHIVLLTHPGRVNRGQSASLNLGLRAAKGVFLAILDSDDMFAPNKLKAQADYLQGHPDVGMVYGQGHAVNSEGIFLFEVPADGHTEPGDPNRLLLDCYMALPGGAMIRKAVMDNVGFFEESFRSGQDHDMALRLMEQTKVTYIQELVFYYRKHGDSISSKGLRLRWETGMRILKRAADRYPYQKSTLRKRKAVLHFRLGQTCWRESRKFKAAQHILLAGTLNPKRAISVILGRDKA